MNQLATIPEPRTTRFDPNARSFEAFQLTPTTPLGRLAAATLELACAEATERWHWERGDRLGIRETGQEDAPIWPFDKQPIDCLHVYAVRRSAPLRWVLTDDLMRTRPVYKYKLELVCTIDLRELLAPITSREAGSANNAPASNR